MNPYARVVYQCSLFTVMSFIFCVLLYEQDLEEHGGGLGQGDHTVPQRVRRQPGDALLPLVVLPQLSTL